VSLVLPLPIHPEALLELDAAVEWYEIEKAGLGDELLEAVVQVLENGVALSYQESDDFGEGRTVRRYLTRRFPYTLFVLETPTTPPTVVAVAHQSRQEGYWKSRVLPEDELGDDLPEDPDA
jgi:toxin ParE1/3/4